MCVILLSYIFAVRPNFFFFRSVFRFRARTELAKTLLFILLVFTGHVTFARMLKCQVGKESKEVISLLDVPDANAPSNTLYF